MSADMLIQYAEVMQLVRERVPDMVLSSPRLQRLSKSGAFPAFIRLSGPKSAPRWSRNAVLRYLDAKLNAATAVGPFLAPENAFPGALVLEIDDGESLVPVASAPPRRR
jgi:hypothetical protein